MASATRSCTWLARSASCRSTTGWCWRGRAPEDIAGFLSGKVSSWCRAGRLLAQVPTGASSARPRPRSHPSTGVGPRHRGHRGVMSNDKATEAREGLFDSVTGKAKEVAGAVSGNDDLVEEGQLQQAEARNRKEAVADDAVADAKQQEAAREIREAGREAAQEKAAAGAQAAQEESAVERRRAVEHAA